MASQLLKSVLSPMIESQYVVVPGFKSWVQLNNLSDHRQVIYCFTTSFLHP